MHKRIMIVAGGDWQVPITKKAKEMGLYVISSNLYEDSPAFAYADAVKIANVLDREANLACAERYKPDAVVTDQSDIAVPTVAYICQRLGLPGIGEDKASLFTNKYKMREFCAFHILLSQHCFLSIGILHALAKIARQIFLCFDQKHSAAGLAVDWFNNNPMMFRQKGFRLS